MPPGETIPSVEVVVGRIFFIRGVKAMLDADLADLYGVETRALTQAVKRNQAKFPTDFMFQLTDSEWSILRSQNVISRSHGGRRYPPYAFTEHGALMLSSVLHSSRATEISIMVVRAFVLLRQMMPAHQEISSRLGELERKVGEHDQSLIHLIEAIQNLLSPPDKGKKTIGF